MTHKRDYPKMPPLKKIQESPAWKNYVVPCNQLWALVGPHLEKLNNEFASDPNGFADGRVGAKEHIATRVEKITRGRRRPETIVRRIYDMENMRSRIMDADLADAILLACNIRMEDTDIQVFPGNRRNAREMVEVRRPDLDELGVERLARILLAYRDKVVYPEGFVAGQSLRHQERLRREGKLA